MPLIATASINACIIKKQVIGVAFSDRQQSIGGTNSQLAREGGFVARAMNLSH
ncbi:MAG: hypothetical protein ABJA67_00340 [Chthonomonadales bacterium]